MLLSSNDDFLYQIGWGTIIEAIVNKFRYLNILREILKQNVKKNQFKSFLFLAL